MNRTYIPTLIILAIFAILHYVGGSNHWYYRFPGFDIIMHILGGIGLAFSIYWILSTFFKSVNTSFLIIVILTVVAGIIWEWMEYEYDIAGGILGTTAYYVDTIKDLCSDTLGAIIAFIFIKK